MSSVDLSIYESPPPRGLFSTVLISVLMTAFCGFLWIGRGRAAIWFLALGFPAGLVISFLILAGMLPPLNLGQNRWLLLAGGLGINALVSLLLVLPQRERSRPIRWYSKSWGFVAIALCLWAATETISYANQLFGIRSFSAPSSAMEPTIRVGDYFSVSKSAYGYGRVDPSKPARGDIVAFHAPNTQIIYVSRLIGLPGDHVEMVNGVLHLNGVAVQLEEAGKQTVTGEAGRVAVIQRETLPDGATYFVQDISVNGPGDNTEEFLVPGGHFFAMGDNRDNSADSRFGPIAYGFVPFDNIIGRAKAVYWNATGEEYRDRKNLLPVTAAGS